MYLTLGFVLALVNLAGCLYCAQYLAVAPARRPRPMSTTERIMIWGIALGVTRIAASLCIWMAVGWPHAAGLFFVLTLARTLIYQNSYRYACREQMRFLMETGGVPGGTRDERICLMMAETQIMPWFRYPYQ